MIAGSNILQNASWMDPVGGLVISLMVVQAGWGNTQSAILELADVNLSEDMKRKIRRSAESGLKELGSDGIEVRQVQGVKAGQNYLIELELGISGDVPVSKTKELEDKLRNHIGSKVRGAKRVKVRFVPLTTGPPDFTDEFVGSDVESPRSSPEPESDDEHHHDHKHPHSH